MPQGSRQVQQYRYRWSIAIYHGRSPLALQPVEPRNLPTLTVRHVTDATAHAVADPFMLRHGGTLTMFFEMLNAATGRGEIACATSLDGLAWQYRSVVLREEIHLSYPLVFEWQGAVHMIPETRQAGEVRLYRAEDFPTGWRQVATLLHGPFADATLHHDGRTWWLFAQRGLDELRLFHAEQPPGPWREHPCSPLWPGNRSRTRPGGRLLSYDGRLIRLAQDAWPAYGSCLRAFAIDRLDTQGYAEHELPESPILGASRSGWNALAMHHLDVLRGADGQWLGAVDGATLGLG
jgi:hypothetical protein